MKYVVNDQTLLLPRAVRSYEDAPSGVTVVGNTIPKIIQAVKDVRISKGMEVDDVDFAVHEYVCERIPGFCSKLDTNKRELREYTKSDVLAFLASVAGTIKNGPALEKEAQSRANTCISCPYNKRLAGCEGCNGVAESVFNVIGKKTVVGMGSLNNCKICGCTLKAKIWVPDVTLKKTARIQNNMDAYPEWCWVKK